MMLLESPTASAGIAAWNDWLSQLNKLSASKQNDQSVKLAKLRAEKMIRILTDFPGGLSSKDPQFSAVLRKYR